MEFTTFVFYFLAIILVLTSLRVITSRNPVHAAMHLVLAFFTASGIWVLLGAELLAIILVLVYVGAVMVLFLFVVMMLDINIDRLREGFWTHLPLGIAVALLMAVEMGFVLWATPHFRVSEAMLRQAQDKAGFVAENYNNVKEVGRLLFTEYVYPFELASVVLLVGIVAATVLTLREKRKSNKSVDPSQQVFVKAKDRLRILQIPSEKKD